MEQLSDSEIIDVLKKLVVRERGTTAEIVRYLHEVDTRKLYIEAGYSSLFMFCVEALGYPKGTAFRYATGARAVAEHPEIVEKLRDGTLTICVIAEVYKVKEPEKRATLLSVVEGQSKEEVQAIVAAYLPPAPLRREIVKVRKTVIQPDTVPLFGSAVEPIADKAEEVRFSLNLELDAETMELLDMAKALTGSGSKRDTVKKVLKEFVARRSPQNRTKRREERKKLGKRKAVRTTTRHVPLSTRDRVWVKDDGRCSFVGHEGHRCSERHSLELDHIKPWAFGGAHDEENLRLLCPSHHRCVTERTFGLLKA